MAEIFFNVATYHQVKATSHNASSACLLVQEGNNILVCLAAIVDLGGLIALCVELDGRIVLNALLRGHHAVLGFIEIDDADYNLKIQCKRSSGYGEIHRWRTCSSGLYHLATAEGVS